MATFIQLNHYQLIEVVGVDAEKFLQGQLTCDVVKLAIGQHTLAAHCDPKGKMTSIFRLIRTDVQQFLLLIKKDLLQSPSALDMLKKYAVFSKVEFNLLNWSIVGMLGEENVPQAQICINLGERAILFNPQANLDYNGTIAQWEVAEIKAGIPNLPPQSQNEFLPQALNLQAVEQAVSFSKGCYIGQEMVARAKYRGANKRAMFSFYAETDFCPEIGGEIEMKLESNWRKTGTILNVANVEGQLWLQVVMNNSVNDSDQFRLSATEIPLQRYPLPYLLE